MVYSWPGNVRELSHYIERAVILNHGRRLTLPGHDHVPSVPAETAGFPSLDQVIKNHIIDALTQCRWKVSGKNGAAALLKMNPQTLYSRMHKMGILKRGG